MAPKKSKTSKSLNESNAERRWSGETVNFGAILDGENEFIRAYDTGVTATDSSSGDCTVTDSCPDTTVLTCSDVFSRTIDTMKLSTGKFELGHTD